MPQLNDWLQQRALRNERSGASRTYVVLGGSEIAGYYCISAGSIAHIDAPKSLRRNMPDPIPAAILGRLAVARPYQGTGLGKALVIDAAKRVQGLAEQMGISMMLLHAISEDARRFYLAQGFLESPLQRMTLCLPMATARMA